MADKRECERCEAMLAEAVDGTLSVAELARFERHLAGCGSCSERLAEARLGAGWMKELRISPPEPSDALMERILAQTSGEKRPVGKVPAVRGAVAELLGWLEQVVLQPRLVMTAAMAFFSIALTLNLAGVRVQDLRLNSLRAGSLQREFYSANARVVQYYEGLRVVYVLESRVRDLQGAMQENAPAGLPTGSEEPQPKAQPGSPAHEPAGQPEQKPQSHGVGPAFRPAPDSGISRRSEPELLVAGMSSYKESDGSRREEQETRG